MINKIIDTITLVGKGIFLTMMFGAIVLFGAATVFPERFKVEESTNTEQSIYDLIREIAPKYNVPIPLAEAIVKQESDR